MYILLLHGVQSMSASMQSLLMLGVALLLFYLILWSPEQKRRKHIQKQHAQMQVGDQVVFSAGLMGTVARIGDHSVHVQVDGAKIEVLKNAITSVEPKKGATSKEGE